MKKSNPVGRPKIKPQDKKISVSISISANRLKELTKHYKSISKAIDYIPVPKPVSE